MLRARLGLAVTAWAVCLLDCRDATAIPGRSVVPYIARAIDDLRTSLPDLQATDIACPESIHLAGGAHGLCQLTLDGKRIDVDVWQESPGNMKLLFQGSLVDVDLIVRTADAQARRSASPDTRTDCGAPRFRFLAVGDTLGCTASRPGWSHDWRLRVTDRNGSVFLPNGFPAEPGAPPRTAITRLAPFLPGPHRDVPGADIAAALVETPLDPDIPVSSAHCPAQMDLSDGKADFCGVMLAGQTARIRVEVADGSWRTQLDGQVLLVMSRIEREAERTGVEMARSRGVPGVVLQVDCGPKRVEVAIFPVRKTCDLTFPDGKHRPVTLLLSSQNAAPKYFFGDPKDARE